jgi:hypothetical protein
MHKTYCIISIKWSFQNYVFWKWVVFVLNGLCNQYRKDYLILYYYRLYWIIYYTYLIWILIIHTTWKFKYDAIFLVIPSTTQNWLFYQITDQGRLYFLIHAENINTILGGLQSLKTIFTVYIWNLAFLLCFYINSGLFV